VQNIFAGHADLDGGDELKDFLYLKISTFVHHMFKMWPFE